MPLQHLSTVDTLSIFSGLGRIWNISIYHICLITRVCHEYSIENSIVKQTIVTITIRYVRNEIVIVVLENRQRIKMKSLFLVV